MDNYFLLVKTQYENSRGDSTGLFQAIVAIAQDIGMEESLGYLEQCVQEKRLAWIDDQLITFQSSGYPVQDGYKLFFENYLGVMAPRDGEIVEATPQRILMRWWNDCPTLKACIRLGLDTRQVCRAAYHQPVDAFLKRIDPRLKFERNYAAIRPHMPYCEEMILLQEDT